MRRGFLAALLIIFSFHAIAGEERCQGKFLNPITDICWKYMFPITIGSTTVVSGENPDTENRTSPVCSCSDPVPRVGLSIGFWEPIRLVDVTRTPFCFVNLGGKKMDLDVRVGQSAVETEDGQALTSHYHLHWYVYPAIFLLNLIADFVCLEAEGFDLAYLTELDPTWQDDELAFILNPEAVLFANPIAQASCAADCVAASSGMPFDPLFWCAGCQGSMYPFSGNVQAHIGGVQASLLLTERMTYKLHRMGLLWGSVGTEALCGKYPMPIMRKSQYRAQMTYPVPTTSGKHCCSPYGRSTELWSSLKEFPVKGEDFGYLVWRKRACCAL